MQRPVDPSFGRVKLVVDGLKHNLIGGGWVKTKEQKRIIKS